MKRCQSFRAFHPWPPGALRNPRSKGIYLYYTTESDEETHTELEVPKQPDL